jgi:hypothetical protein
MWHIEADIKHLLETQGEGGGQSVLHKQTGGCTPTASMQAMFPVPAGNISAYGL